MSFKKPFRAVPIKSGKHFQKRRKAKPKNAWASYLGGAALAGAAIGTGSIALSDGGPSAILSGLKPIAVSAGLMRARSPQEGDYWPGCDSARAAGTAPIYAGEPGYREGMDGDGDGIACEPYR